MFPAARIGDPITHDMLIPCGVIGPGLPAPCPLCARGAGHDRRAAGGPCGM